ncbi:MAG: hypothetical protein ACI959_001575, partial [Limisphaerales bacterium]
MSTVFNKPKWVQRYFSGGFKKAEFGPNDRLALKKRLEYYRVSNPEVTVILPVQNNADSIYRTLESLSFRLHPWATDLIIIDNNSTDGT